MNRKNPPQSPFFKGGGQCDSTGSAFIDSVRRGEGSERPTTYPPSLAGKGDRGLGFNASCVK